MKSSRRLNRRRRERCHLLVLKFYSLSSFSVFLRLSASVSVFLAVRSLLRSLLSLSLSLKLFLLPVVSKTPTSLRNLSEKTRERTKTTEDTKFCLLLFALRQTDRRKESVAHLSPFVRARERLLERSRGKKSFALSLSLCVYIYRAHTASSS